ncbi:MAG: excinuclease ABC subunit UvrC [bacterium]
MNKEVLHNAKLPQKPGVYIFKNKHGDVLYVGKAINLKSRVTSYWNVKSLAPDKQIMMPLVAKLDHIVVNNEVEALLLEQNLIKKYKPRFNVLMKDDKSYKYIKITYNEPFPKIISTRTVLNDKAVYLGPYTDGSAINLVLKILNKVFPYCNCGLDLNPNKIKAGKLKACFRYHLGKCPGPSVGAISQKDYRALIKKCESFLRGNYSEVSKELKKEMTKASTTRNFEKASVYRDRLQALQKIIIKQNVVTAKNENQDFINLSKQGHQAAIVLMKVRDGKMLNQIKTVLAIPKDVDDEQIISSYITNYYQFTSDLPKEIVVPVKLSLSATSLDKFIRSKNVLGKLSKAKLKITKPERGRKKQLLKIAAINAKNEILKATASFEQNNIKEQLAVKNLAKLLKIKNLTRIEGYDISNIQGQNATGSMIVFQNGVPARNNYRRFKIRMVAKSNDVAMMAEMLTRRFKQSKTSEEKWPLPDLVVIDGGKGQLNAALKVLQEQKIKRPVISLAKRLETVLLPKNRVLKLDKKSPEQYLLERLRDEAHRFAITYHKNLRSKQFTKSALDEIQGIGPKTKKLLLQNFGTVAKIREASAKEIAQITGRKLATKLKAEL